VRSSAGVATVEIDPPGRISTLNTISESPDPGWINTGVALLPRAWLKELPADTPLSLERDVLPYWLSRGVGGCCVHAPFLTIATPQAMAGAPAFFASIRKPGELSSPAGG
jgi:NDP-sugar pyrophosphorylase family protein